MKVFLVVNIRIKCPLVMSWLNKAWATHSLEYCVILYSKNDNVNIYLTFKAIYMEYWINGLLQGRAAAFLLIVGNSEV